MTLQKKMLYEHYAALLDRELGCLTFFQSRKQPSTFNFIASEALESESVLESLPSPNSLETFESDVKNAAAHA